MRLLMFIHAGSQCSMLYATFETWNDAVGRPIIWTSEETSQPRPGLNNKVLVFGELIVVFQTLRIGKSTRRFDGLSRHYLFDRQFHFLQVYCCL